MLKLMLITNDITRAEKAEKAGVDRIFVDLEYIGKKERQNMLDTYVPGHSFEDISNLKKVLKRTEVLARINPYYEGSKTEIDECIERGANIIMLPMFKTKYEVQKFINDVAGRAKTSLLLETPQALVRIREILEVEGIDEFYVGLNDLHLGMKLDFLFELLSGGVVDYIAELVKRKNILFGFGGLAKIGAGVIPAEELLGEHYRIGSNMVILSQVFDTTTNLELDIEKIRLCESEIKLWSENVLQKNSKKIKNRIEKFVFEKNSRELNC